MGGIGIWQLLIVLLIVFLLFGGKKIRTLGSDLGSALRGFKKELGEQDNSHTETKTTEDPSDKTNH